MLVQIENSVTVPQIMTSTTQPAAGGDASSGQCFQSYHQHLISISEGKEPDIVFLGDHTTAFLSITQVWDILFAQSHSLNLSAVEDKTQTLLWRIENSLLDKVTPKVVVISIGANNLRGGDTPEDVAAGVDACVKAVKAHKPNKPPFIIVMGIIPCCQKESPIRELVAQTNQLLRGLIEKHDDTQLIDVSNIFIKEDGSISHTDLFDFFHLTKYGYYKAFEPVHDLASQILQEAYGIKFTKSTDRLCDMDGTAGTGS